MPSNPLLTLSSKGLLTGAEDKIDYIFAVFLSANVSQTYLYLGQIKSLAAILQEANGDAQVIQQTVQVALNSMFAAQFDTVTTTVGVTTPSKDGSNRWNISVDIQLTENGKTYFVGNVLQSINGITNRIVQHNNLG